MKVFKFGGASVKDAEAIRNVARIIKMYENDQLLVVISAMGKTTNALENILTQFINDNAAYAESIAALKKFHFNILEELYQGEDPSAYHQLEDLFLQFEWFFELGEKDNYDFLYDQIVGFGEIFSTKIIATYLQSVGIKAKWLDARNFIITNDNYREAAIDFKLTESMVQRKIPDLLSDEIIITQGFIGKNRQGHATTLGREGSDFTAAIFAWALNAQEVDIWKDVPGILNADPKKFSDTILFEELSYRDAVEMSYYGASVLHPKTMQPLQNRNIPLHVRSFVKPEESGTMIFDRAINKQHIPVIIAKENQCLVHVASNNFDFIAERNLSRIFQAIAQNRVKINLMRNSAMRFTFCTDFDERKLNALKTELEPEFVLETEPGLRLLTIRNATDEYIDKLTDNQELILEQKIEHVAQFVLQ
ncbi:aspartate kinase [bacterium]|nr:aspartate kinase [bacterium]